jgi:hypothetical protein
VWAKDRDLLAIEPSLLRDVAWTGQTVFSGTASISAFGSAVLSWAPAASVSILPGMVLVARRTAMEITSAPSATQLGVSLLRASGGEGALVPRADADAPATIVTFRPQIALAHRQLLEMLGLGAGDAWGAVINPESLIDLEALLALKIIYGAAWAGTSDDGPAARRAEMYRQRFEQARGRALAMIDTDGDGVADCARRFNTVRLWRS